jgi:hypothetical protein
MQYVQNRIKENASAQKIKIMVNKKYFAEMDN